MLPPIKPLSHLIDACCHGVTLSVGISVIATVTVISYGVLAREVLHLSDVWITEITTYLMAYMTFVGMAALAWQSGHLKVDVLGHYLNERGRRVLTFVSTLVVTLVAIVITALAAQFWYEAFTSGERSWGMFSVPLWIPYLCFIGGTLMLTCVQMIRLVTIIFDYASDKPKLTVDRLAPGREK